MKALIKLTIVVYIFTGQVYSQIGIGTTTPDESSILDISATDKGILIPRVSLDNVTTTQLDGVNTAASGLLIWNTNPATIGGSGIGFYYFDGVWMALSSSATDADWFEQGTTDAPNAITDNIFTNGAVGINTNAIADRQLHVEAGNLTSHAGYFSNISTTTGSKYGLRTSVTSNTNSSKYGVYNALGSIDNTGILYGTYNNLFGDNNEVRYGTYNNFNGLGGGSKYGVYTYMDGTTGGNVWGTYNNIDTDQIGQKVGVENRITGSVGSISGTINTITMNGNWPSYGTENTLTGTSDNLMYASRNIVSGAGTGNKYGSYNTISTTAGGIHFGVFSEVLKPASYAGYFRGALAIGTTLPTIGAQDYYVMPSSRGTANQIMQTDGAGVVSWVDNVDSVTVENGLTETSSVVRLGGPLIQNTTISTGAYDLDIDLTSFGDFHIQDAGINHFSVESAGTINFGGDVYWSDESTTGTVLASLIDSGDDGRFRIYENGLTAIDLNANGTSVINEQGLDRDFRIESDDNPLALGVNGGENVMFAGTNTLSLTNNGAIVNGVTVEYVASFYRDDLTNGTAIQIGSTEYLTDFGNLIWGPYGSWAPFSDNTFDLGTSTFRWDDVYATSGVVNTSDIRLKENIKDLKYGLEEVLKLEPISYQWKHSRDPFEVKIGFSAQQLLTVLPEVVKTQEFVYPDENGPGVLQAVENLGVYYSDIIPVLTKAIQEQQALILKLEQRINTLENKN